MGMGWTRFQSKFLRRHDIWANFGMPRMRRATPLKIACKLEAYFVDKWPCYHNQPWWRSKHGQNSPEAPSTGFPFASAQFKIFSLMRDCLAGSSPLYLEACCMSWRIFRAANKESNSMTDLWKKRQSCKSSPLIKDRRLRHRFTSRTHSAHVIDFWWERTPTTDKMHSYSTSIR